MGHYKKLYLGIKNNPHDVKFESLEKLLTKVGGFTSHPGKGDHYNMTHPDLDHLITIDTRGKHRPLKAIYVKKAIRIFEELNPNFVKED